MAVTRWKQSARSGGPTVSVMTTGLNSLANNAAVLSSTISNDAADELDLFMDLELVVTFGTNPTENSLIEIYIVRSVDGTNFEGESTEGRPKDGYVGGFILDNVTSAQRIIKRRIEAPPEDFKVYVINKSGQAMASSGNTITALFYTLETA